MAPMTALKVRRFEKGKALKGQLVWQGNNCQSCHQLYGLGGYLGPDLTNVYSGHGKGEVLVRVMLKNGVKQMPAFRMPEEDIQNLLEFLKSVDASGKSDPRTFHTTYTGMAEKK